MTKCLQIRGYHSPYFWTLAGDITNAKTSSVGALTGSDITAIGGPLGTGSFGGVRQVFTGLLIEGTPAGGAGGFTINQRVTGSTGNTTVELYRYQDSVWTLLATATLTSSAGNGASIVAGPATVPLCQLSASALLAVCLTSVQSASGTSRPNDLTATVSFT